MRILIISLLFSTQAMAVECYKWGDVGVQKPIYTFEGDSCPLGYYRV